MRWGSRLLALSPHALRIAKRALALARGRGGGEAIEAAERLYLAELLHAPDAIEGLEAFLEKRSPRWASQACASAARRAAFRASTASAAATKDPARRVFTSTKA